MHIPAQVLLFVISSFSAQASSDPLEFALGSTCSNWLSWDRVEGSPYWISGPVPAYDRETHTSWITLGPGSNVLLRLPAFSALRILFPLDHPNSHMVETSCSNGSGAFIHFPLNPCEDSRSLILEPDSSETLLIRVGRPSHLNGAVRFALFVSKREPLPKIVSSVDSPERTENSVLVYRADDSEGTAYSRVGSSHPLLLSVEGPVRIAIESRLSYRDDDSAVHQDYALFSQLDSDPPFYAPYRTSTENRDLFTLDERAVVIGQSQWAYVAVPWGRHELRVQSTADVYLRLQEHRRDSFLLPRINWPFAFESAARSFLGTTSPRSPWWEVSPMPGGRQIPPATERLSISQHEIGIDRLMHDNTYRDGGSTGLALSRSLSRAFPKFPRLRYSFEKLKARHSFYRNLLPRGKKLDSLQVAYFTPRRLRDDSGPEQRTVLPMQHCEDWIDKLPSAWFVPLPNVADSFLEYPVPPHSAPTTARISITRPGVSEEPETLLVQLDEKPPLRIDLRERDCAPGEETAARFPEVALWISSRSDFPQGFPTLSGSFSRQRIPGLLRSVRTAEFDLPQDVKEIRISRVSSCGGGVSVALQYRVSRSYRLGVSAYLHHLDVIGAKKAREILLTSAEVESTGVERAACEELKNHWIPLLQSLNREKGEFEKSIQLPSYESSQSVKVYSNDEARRLMETSFQLRERAEYIKALETYSLLLHSVPTAFREKALQGRIDCLVALGEDYLAALHLRNYFIFSPAEASRSWARQRLEDLYERIEDDNGTRRLASTAILHGPTEENLAALATVFAAAGDYEDALTVGLLARETESVHTALLTAALRLRCWQVFEKTLADVGDPETSWLWRGRRALAFGVTDKAVAAFLQAGEKGIEMANHISRERSARMALASVEATERLEGVAAWEACEADPPGPSVWQDANHRITACAGASLLCSEELNQYSSGFVATSEIPVEACFAGPCQVRVELRPLHSVESVQTLNDWTVMEVGGRRRQIPIINNETSSGLSLITDKTVIPGHKVHVQQSLDVGIQRIRVYGGTNRVLVRFHVLQPVFRSGILPPLTPDTLAAALAGRYARDEGYFGRSGCTQTVDMLERDGRLARGLFPVRVVPAPEPNTLLRNLINGTDDPVVFQRLLLRSNAVESTTRYAETRTAEIGNSLPVSEHRALIERFHCSNTEQTLMSEDILSRTCVARGDAMLTMEELVWIAETNPPLRFRAQILAEKIMHDYPTIPGLRRLYYRIIDRIAWSPVTNIDRSAGIRDVRASRRQPRSIGMRVRRCLMPPIYDYEEILQGGNRLALALFNLSPTRIQLDFALRIPDCVPGVPLRIAYELSSGEGGARLLHAGESDCSITLTAPKGQHVLRCWIQNPTPNHFVTIRARESVADGGNTGTLLWDDLLTDRSVRYHIATQEEPIRARVQGPAWVRIDEERDGSVENEFRYLDPGWQDIILAPAPGRTDGLFRIYKRIPTPASTSPDPNMGEFDRMEEPPARLPEFQMKLPPALDSEGSFRHLTVTGQDDLSLRAYGDGTWSWSLGAERRRAFDEGDDSDRDFDEYLENSLTYRKYGEALDAHFRTRLLSRLRDDGGPTIGLKQTVRLAPDESPAAFLLNGSLHTQSSDGEWFMRDGETEWSADLRGSAVVSRRLGLDTGNRTSFTLFARYLSLDELTADDGGVDIDIYTKHKDDHQYGWTASDTFTYRPWLDTEWWIRGALASNEDLNPFRPDSISLKVGWDQLLGETQTTLTYHYNCFIDDGDRSETKGRDAVSFDILHDFLQQNRNRFELDAGARYDFERADLSANILLRWHVSHRRDYKDFQPGEIDFTRLRTLRRLKTPPDINRTNDE